MARAKAPTPAELKKLLSRLASVWGRRGGKARARKLTPEQRREIARKASLARWRKKKA